MSLEERPRVVLVNRCFIKNDEGKILIICRARQDRHNAGQWEVPGGKLDMGQDLSHALAREVLEETGLLVQQTYPLVFADSYVIGTGSRYTGLPYVVLFSVGRVVGGSLTLSEEHSAYVWVTYAELFAYAITVEVKKAAIRLGHLLER